MNLARAARLATRAPLSIAAIALSSAACSQPPPSTTLRPFSDPTSGSRASTADSEGRPVTPRRSQPTLIGAPRRPDVDAAPICAPNIVREIERMRRGHVSLHGEPVCTEDYDGEWAAVFVTGTDEEASSVWVAVAAGGRIERHRVQRTPVGVRFSAATIARGLAVLVGRSLASEEMPANAEVLVTFALPFSGGGPPEVLPLQPSLLALLGATDRVDLDGRLQSLATTTTTSSDLVRPVLGRALEGPRTLIGALPSTQSIPVLRAWQRGVYQRLGELHPQLDPTNGRVSVGHEIVRRASERASCDEGWRCVATLEPRRTLPDVAEPLQVQFKRDGDAVVIAAIIDRGERADAPSASQSARLGAPRTNDPRDRALAEQLALDPIEGPVAGNSLGALRLLAFTTVEGDRRVTHVYSVAPNRAPRRFVDEALDGTSGARTVQIRDIDGDDQPEILSAASASGPSTLAVSTLLWPPTVTDRTTFTRLDAMRAIFEARSLEDAERALRSFTPSSFEGDAQVCQAIARIAQSTPRQIATLVPPSGLTVIDYATSGHPLRGRARRMSSADLRGVQDIASILGPFASTPCSELECEPALGFCKLRRGDREVGYLWLSPRRNQPLWGLSRFTGR